MPLACESGLEPKSPALGTLELRIPVPKSPELPNKLPVLGLSAEVTEVPGALKLPEANFKSPACPNKEVLLSPEANKLEEGFPNELPKLLFVVSVWPKLRGLLASVLENKLGLAGSLIVKSPVGFSVFGVVGLLGLVVLLVLVKVFDENKLPPVPIAAVVELAADPKFVKTEEPNEGVEDKFAELELPARPLLLSGFVLTSKSFLLSCTVSLFRLGF